MPKKELPAIAPLGATLDSEYFFLGLQPRLTMVELAELYAQRMIPAKVFSNPDYEIAVYDGESVERHFPENPEKGFLEFTKDLKPILGERALSEHVKFIPLIYKER